MGSRMKCEFHKPCDKQATMQLPYARLCHEHYMESKKSFQALPAEEKARIRREWKVMGVTCPW